MQKMNESSLASGYIKQMLREFNLPKATVLKDKMRVFDGRYYMDGMAISKCIQSGVYDKSKDNTKLLSKVTDYQYGRKYINLTRNLEPRGTLYDSYTHEYLGDYLRFCRDFSGIDLMSMYNCFCGDVARNVSLSFEVPDQAGDSDKTKVSFDSSDSSSVLYVVPIRFGQQYTIGIDCVAPIEVVACFYEDGGVIEFNDNLLCQKTYARHSGNALSKPFLYSKAKDYFDGESTSGNGGAMRAEHSLALLIKAPASNASSLTVLEGDFVRCSEMSFSKRGQEPIFVVRNYESGVTERDERSYYSKLQLLMINDGESHPFADKLIDYLVGNVITPMDGIPDNIRRLQKSIINRFDGTYSHARLPGAWESVLRDYAYDLAKSRGVLASSFDVLGYIDKDVEGLFGSDISYDTERHTISGGTR